DALYVFCRRHADIIGLAFVVWLVIGSPDTRLMHAVIFLFPFLIAGAIEAGSFTTRMLSNSAVHYLGKISYSIYLVHAPWYQIVAKHLPSPISGGSARPLTLLTFIVEVGGMLALASLSYHAVEMPLRRLVRDAIRSPRSGAVHSPRS